MGSNDYSSGFVLKPFRYRTLCDVEAPTICLWFWAKEFTDTMLGIVTCHTRIYNYDKWNIKLNFSSFIICELLLECLKISLGNDTHVSDIKQHD